MEKNKIALFVLPILVLFLISFVSAQTLVAGKVYNSDYSDTISDASITVTCNLDSLTTISLSDGTYAVRFDETECDLGDNVQVVANKDGLTDSKSGVIIECDDQNDCAEGYVSIINLALKTATNNGGSSGGRSSGGGGRVYICGDGKCDSGENERTCPKDCEVSQTTSTSQTSDNEENENTGEEGKTGENDNQGFFAGITGAVVGTLGKNGAIGVLIFIIVIIGISITTFVIRRKKLQK